METPSADPAAARSPTAVPFPIVGVGASAGGLAPTSELLHELGPDPGLALVIVHHLDPKHESGLAEILARATPMPVAAAVSGVRAEMNHVYVVPPNAGLLIHHGILEVVPRVEVGGLHLPINRFFESLARDCDGWSVGVVLSGSGFDGTEGIRAIKREGGITLAQDASAEYRSMPESAIATGNVDFMLPPAALARELLRLAAHAPSVVTPARGSDERDYTQILATVQRACGVDFTSYKPTTIRRRLQRRLFLHGITDLSAYLDLLQRKPAEIAALCEEVLIHVTGFFREPEAFEALAKLVFPKLCEARAPDAAIRVWVPGCSSGEEVYSLAMCLLEFLDEGHRGLQIKIFGTDLSLPVIEKARAGRYPQSIEAEVSPARLQRFFVKEETGYRIRRDVRDLCVFAQHDVTRDPPFSGMDLISCRNLMIYLGPALQERVIALLHYALNEPGFLMLGSTETVRTFAGFASLDGKNKIFARTSAAPRLAFDFTTPRPPLELASSPLGTAFLGDAGPRVPGSSDVQREADRLVLAEFAPPGVVVTNDLAVVQFRGRTGLFLEHAPGVASLDLLRTAREELRLPIRRAIDRARGSLGTERETGITLTVAEKRHTVDIEVIPFSVHSARQRYFLVLFQESTTNEPAPPPVEPTPVAGAQRATELTLRQDLASTRQYLEAVIEQLEATNEELRATHEEVVSSNEELRSTNEEMQSAKEELQATNEELLTVNEEMRDRSVESTRLSDDLTNVLTSVEIPIVIIGRDLRLRRFTPAAARLFHLVASDIGRPMSDVRLVTVAPPLTSMVPDVLQRLVASECDIQETDGRWQHLTARPYVTTDGRIDGTVIVARDVDVERQSNARLVAAQKYVQSIVDTVRDGLVVLDRELHVVSTNKAFRRVFRLEAEDIVGRSLDALGRAELADPTLKKLLQEHDGDVQDFRIEQHDDGGGRRSFLLNSRRVEESELVLLAVEDVTEAERARAAADRVDLGFRDALMGAAEGVLIVEADGHILFVNRVAAELFGYDSDELVGQNHDILVPDRMRGKHAKLRTDYLANPAPRPMGPDRDLTGRRKDGSTFPIEVTLGTMRRDDRLVVVAFVSDITKRRETEKAILTYQEKLQRMAFDAALTEERERRRIAIDLHDHIGQQLALAEIKLKGARQDLHDEARAAVDSAVDLLEQAIASSRTLIFELSPPILYDLGLKDAIAWLAEDIGTRFGLKIDVIDDEEEKALDDNAKAVVFRAVRELLMNVLKHAKTTGATVHLRRMDDRFDITVEDQGVGFDANALADASPAHTGFGILSVKEQIAQLDGTIQVTSSPQRGTSVNVRVPLQSVSHSSEKVAP